jgi:phosphate transport system substrate-binding protein
MNAKEVLKFFEWSFKSGDKMAGELDYIPMPDAVVKMIETSWKGLKGADGKAVY